MPNRKPHQIDTGKYDLAVKTFSRIKRMFGLNIKVHGNENKVIDNGQIFLFNHFARFETMIPPYIIHRETGAYCRSVADKGLFAGNGKFAKLLHDLGVVPTNIQGLLPFLAAEILRGNKVIIFPEGAMIKDRRITDSEGSLGIFSHKHNVFRKHHQGAAALALTLELFKKRILSVFADGNDRRIEHWQNALGLPSREALFEQASKPTLIIPGAITFYPIRIDDNILTKSASFLSKNPSIALLEELAIEGNILLKDTDMDIRLGAPITAKHSWQWWDNVLMRQYFKKIDSLEQFFGLKETANNWTEKLLVSFIGKETGRIRDAYMEGIYKQTTVNLAHLASILLLDLVEKGYREIDITFFHKILYLSLKKLQDVPNVSLHRSLTWPDSYYGLVDDNCPDLDRFMDTCQKAGLISHTNTAYQLLDKLSDPHKFQTVRIENPVVVNANEVAPLKEVKEAVVFSSDKVMDHKTTPQELATNLFDDECRSHNRNKAYYNKKRYEELNNKETATKSGSPSLLIPQTNTPRKHIGILLVHGFLASPAEMEGLAESLWEDGYSVLNVRLAGHGTSPWDLQQHSWRDWLSSVRRNYRILSAFVDDIVIVGFSMGGALSLLFSTENPPDLAGVASISAPLNVQNKGMIFVPLIHQLNQLVRWIPGVEGLIPFYDNDPDNPDINYRTMPVKSVNELKEVMSVTRKHLKDVKVPVTVIQGNKDKTVKPSSAKTIFNNISTENKTLHWIQTKEHALVSKNVGNTHQLVKDFIIHTTKVKLLENKTG